MSWAVTAPEAATTQVYAIANSFSAPIHRPMMLPAHLRRVARLVFPAAAALSFACSPLAAEDVPAPQAEELQADPYVDIFLVLDKAADRDLILENIIAAFLAEIVQQHPIFELMEADRPGLLAGLADTIRPTLRKHTIDTTEVAKPRMIALFREGLSAEEAAQVAAFYGSELGQKLMVGAFGNYTGERSLRSAIENPEADIPTNDLRADIQSAAVKSYLDLTAEERKALDRIALESAALAKFVALLPQMTALRHEIENMPMAPEVEAQMIEDMSLFFDSHLASRPDE